ncbi:MAG: MBL fold metallo-hydrolase [Lachnospiraceae bacterium]|nr:MBL fold metallo-hydrolase [Lachnospiraceae bacterium]
MKVTVLCDNYARYSQRLKAEHGASYYIEDGDTRILLDTGSSDLFLENAEKLDIDLSRIQYLVLSHGHWDHTDGLVAFTKKFGVDVCKNITLITHPQAFLPKYDEDRYIGCPLSLEELSQYFQVKLTTDPLILAPGFTYLGQIPRRFDFENKTPLGTTVKDGQTIDDYLYDDSAIAYQSGNGVYVITGCSHSGICNITEYAKDLTGATRVLGIVGGFHLHGRSEQLAKATAYLKQEQIPELYPAHCTSYEARFAMKEEIPIKELGVGLILDWR